MPAIERILARAVALAGLAALGAPAPSWAQDKSVLVEPRPAMFESVDPARGFDDMVDMMVRQVYSTLLTYAYLERPYKLEPDLLESMPTASPDKLTWTFHLRKGVRFVDNPCFPGGKGRVLTADDVLYSLKRYADGNLNIKSWFALQGAIVGLDDFHAATLKAGPSVDLTSREVAGLHKVDDWTFTIRLTHENGLFLHALAMGPTSVVPREAVQFYKDRFSVNPVGTGPFMATQALDRKATIRLLRNPGYYRTYPSAGAPGDAEKGLLKDAGKPLPLVDVLELPLIEEYQPATLKFLHGDLDLRLLGSDRAGFTKLATKQPDGGFRLVDQYAGKFKLYGAPGNELLDFRLNLRDPVLGRSKYLRQALAAAFDSRDLVDRLYNGLGRPLRSIVPLEIPGSERDTGAVGHPHDLAAARRLLAQAGYPDGKGLPPLTISFYQTNAASHERFDLMKQQLAAIGVQAKGQFMDLPAFTKAGENGNFQIIFFGWVADYPDPENFYQQYYGRNTPPGNNWTAFANPAYDKAYEASRFMANGPERLAYLRTMNAILDDEVPVIPLFDPTRFDVTQNWVSNFKPNMQMREEMYLRVDMASKKKGVQ